MRLSKLMVVAALALPVAALAQKQELQQLQRDFGLLQMDVRGFRTALDEKTAELKTLLQQTLDIANKNSTSIALLEREMKDALAEQQKSVATPVVGLNSKIDTLTEELRIVKENVNITNERINKLQTQLTDLGNTIQTLQSPPPPPGTTEAQSAAPPMGLQGGTLLSDANRDRMSGNLDQSLQEYADYLKYFGNTDQACEAQYYIGDIYYNRREYQNAVAAFDLVLEKYESTCEKKDDARYMKGKSLAEAGEDEAAVAEFQALLKLHPTGPWATKANTELRDLRAPARNTRKK